MSELRSRGDLRPILLICVLAGTSYAAYSLLRHLNYWSGLDTGIFNQAIWHYSNLDAPASTVKNGLDLRADHFHPILMLLAPLYWIADEPSLLLVAQAVLVAASIVPVFLFARERLERASCLCDRDRVRAVLGPVGRRGLRLPRAGLRPATGGTGDPVGRPPPVGPLRRRDGVAAAGEGGHDPAGRLLRRLAAQPPGLGARRGDGAGRPRRLLVGDQGGDAPLRRRRGVPVLDL